MDVSIEKTITVKLSAMEASDLRVFLCETFSILRDNEPSPSTSLKYEDGRVLALNLLDEIEEELFPERVECDDEEDEEEETDGDFPVRIRRRRKKA